MAKPRRIDSARLAEAYDKLGTKSAVARKFGLSISTVSYHLSGFRAEPCGRDRPITVGSDPLLDRLSRGMR